MKTFDDYYQLFERELILQGKSLNTQESYLRSLKRVCRDVGKELDQLSMDDLKTYYFRLQELISWSSINVDRYRVFFVTIYSLEKALTPKGQNIEFTYQDYDSKEMIHVEMNELDFLKSLAGHVKPKGFRAVREYGFLAPAAKRKRQRIQLLLITKLPEIPAPKKPEICCECCKRKMNLIRRKVEYELWVNSLKKTNAPPEENDGGELSV